MDVCRLAPRRDDFCQIASVRWDRVGTNVDWRKNRVSRYSEEKSRYNRVFVRVVNAVQAAGGTIVSHWRLAGFGFVAKSNCS